MSPLNIIKKSYIWSYIFSTLYKRLSKKDYLEYSADNNDFKTFDKEMLIGETGSVYFGLAIRCMEQRLVTQKKRILEFHLDI